MPIPKRKNGESTEKFISRCMADPVMNKEYPKSNQRYAVCQSNAFTNATDKLNEIQEKLNKVKNEKRD